MPSKNRVKIYSSDAYYHLYNRGVNKQPIFTEPRDYRVFESILARYLSPGLEFGRYVSVSNEIDLLAYCLMPNHFHLLVHQSNENGITRLGRRLMTSYSMYFNKKYERIGPLFQDRIKGALVNEESYLWHISRYIHLNPKEIVSDPEKYDYSSYQDYLGLRKRVWLKPDRILDLHLDNKNPYEEFMKDYLVPS